MGVNVAQVVFRRDRVEVVQNHIADAFVIPHQMGVSSTFPVKTFCCEVFIVLRKSAFHMQNHHVVARNFQFT